MKQQICSRGGGGVTRMAESQGVCVLSNRRKKKKPNGQIILIPSQHESAHFSILSHRTLSDETTQ